MTTAEHPITAPAWAAAELTYTADHESWNATPAQLDHPTLTVHRRNPDAALWWQIEFGEDHVDWFEFGDETAPPAFRETAVGLFCPLHSINAVTDLPAGFWRALRAVTTVAEVAELLRRLGATDTTERTRPVYDPI